MVGTKLAPGLLHLLLQGPDLEEAVMVGQLQTSSS